MYFFGSSLTIKEVDHMTDLKIERHFSYLLLWSCKLTPGKYSDGLCLLFVRLLVDKDSEN